MTVHSVPPSDGTPGPPETGALVPGAWRSRFVEEMAALSDIGMPRSIARTLAWLVICEPAHQSAEDLATTLRLSAGSVSTATSTLVRAGLVARRTFAGQRRTYYELRTDGWLRLLDSRLAQLAELGAIADRALVDARTTGMPQQRLAAMRDFYADWEAQFVCLRSRYLPTTSIGAARSAPPAAASGEDPGPPQHGAPAPEPAARAGRKGAKKASKRAG